MSGEVAGKKRLNEITINFKKLPESAKAEQSAEILRSYQGEVRVAVPFADQLRYALASSVRS